MTTRQLADKHEKAVAKALGGRQTPSSGSTPYSKGDITTDHFIIECKTKMVETNSIIIKQEWIDTLEQERRATGKQYKAISISMDCGKTSHYIIDEKLMQQLIQMIKEQ
jgi:hypothetical protein